MDKIKVNEDVEKFFDCYVVLKIILKGKEEVLE